MPPPCRGTGAAPRACAVLASCLRHACNEGMTTRLPPPPPTHLRPPKGWGMKVGRGGQRPPPPEDKVASWGGSGERLRDGPHDRARRKHAPCKPQRQGALAVRTQGRKGDDGRHTASPPPPAEGQVPRLVPAPCLRRAYARGLTARTPPPADPLLLLPPKKGARTARRQRGDMGGGQRTDRNARGRDGW